MSRRHHFFQDRFDIREPEQNRNWTPISLHSGGKPAVLSIPGFLAQATRSPTAGPRPGPRPSPGGSGKGSGTDPELDAHFSSFLFIPISLHLCSTIRRQTCRPQHPRLPCSGNSLADRWSKTRSKTKSRGRARDRPGNGRPFLSAVHFSPHFSSGTTGRPGGETGTSQAISQSEKRPEREAGQDTISTRQCGRISVPKKRVGTERGKRLRRLADGRVHEDVSVHRASR